MVMVDSRDDKVFQEPTATDLEEMRDTARFKRRIIYDCFNASTDGERVTCKEGHKFASKANVTFLATLRGTTPSACQVCLDYDDGGSREG